MDINFLITFDDCSNKCQQLFLSEMQCPFFPFPHFFVPTFRVTPTRVFVGFKLSREHIGVGLVRSRRQEFELCLLALWKRYS